MMVTSVYSLVSLSFSFQHELVPPVLFNRKERKEKWTFFSLISVIDFLFSGDEPIEREWNWLSVKNTTGGEDIEIYCRYLPQGETTIERWHQKRSSGACVFVRPLQRENKQFDLVNYFLTQNKRLDSIHLSSIIYIWVSMYAWTH